MISVITPVYNGERFIESCIKNVIEQNCPNVEHIIVDGGSKDGTVAIIKKYAEQYPHIRWISEKDDGQSDAMNKGVKMARGNILSMLNADDFYEPSTLNYVWAEFKNLPEPSILVGNCNIWNDECEIEDVNKPKYLKFTDLLSGDPGKPFPINPSAYFYHTVLHQKIGLYDKSHHYVMDLDFLLKAVRAASVKYVDVTLGNYRRIEGTKTVSNLENGRNMRLVRSLIRSHRRSLPPLQRLLITVAYEFKLNQERFFYYTKNPEKVISKLRSLQISSKST